MIWNLQVVPEVLLEVIDDITLLAFETLTDESRPVVNVTEWAKRERCWEQVKAQEYELPTEISEFLMSKDEIKEAKTDAVKQQKVDSGISGQVRVLELGDRYWSNAREFALRMGALTEKESSILALVANPSSSKIPSEVQSKVLLEFLDRITSMGFVGK